MATAALGTLQEFKPDAETIAAYLERVNLYFEANDIAAEKRVVVLLNAIGSKTYSLLRSLTAPDLPQSKSLDALVKMLKDHLEPKPLLIAERFYFHRRDQAVGETISEYVAELRRLATTCEFGDFLNDALRDRLVCGLRNESVQKRLLSEANLTFAKALELAHSMELADKNAKALKGTDSAVKKLSRVPRQGDRQSPAQSTPCSRCGRTNHEASSCRFATATCHHCGKKGHIAPACRSRKSNRRRTAPNHSRPTSAKYVSTLPDDSGSEEFQLLTVGADSSRPIKVEVQVNGKPVPMEVDTGAAVSIISESTLRTLFPDSNLQHSSLVLRTYSNEHLKVLGELPVDVCYDSQSASLSLAVVAGNGPTLLGRNWLKKIRLNWRQIATVSSVKTLDKLLDEHHALFREELGTISQFQAKLQVRPDARPKFFKPRPVPFAIKTAIEEELDRLEASGALRKVTYSDWAAPIVPVPKKDGKFRICGDYKVTVNQALDVDQYPLPKPEDLFATLAGGKKFTKLDLSQAYQQLTLDEESMQYVTVNTHRGLYRYTRLPFGIASAPALFQKLMDSVLQGIPNVICYIDDILVTGADDDDHLHTLGIVLQRLQSYGFRMRRDKCAFLQPSVEYLGHKIDAEGLHALPSKVEAIIRAPAPTNVQELRSFLGLLNYYGKFIPNLATLIHPLNSLLQHGKPWAWTKDCSQAFQQAKEALSSSSVLVHYDPSLPITLAGDASAYGIGAVISHILPDGSEKPIAFASRSLSSSERNYAQLEKEALSLIFGVKKFHQYLYGRKFKLITDHKPLTAILGSKKGIPSLAAARLQRWAILLSGYQYEIVFKATHDHANADGLSRLPLPDTTLGSSSVPSIFNVSQLQSLPVTSAQVETATRRDPVLSKVLLYTKQGWPQETEEVVKPYLSRKEEITVEGDCLMWGIRVIIPKQLQDCILEELHSDHPGASRMKSLARSYLWWPGLDKDIESMAKSCKSCQSIKHAPPPAPLQPWIWPAKPWQRLHIDFAGPFMGRSFLVVVDAHSKWPEVFEMTNTSTAKTIAVLRHLFAAYGLPEQVVSDNGPQFTSEEFEAFMKGNGVKHTRSAPYHPASNGAVERFIQTFKQAMKASDKESHTFSHRLANFLLTYRSTPHATTNRAPCTLFLQRQLRTRFSLLHPSREKQVTKKQFEQVSHHDQHAKPRQFCVGQTVMARNYRQGQKWVQGVLTKQLGPLTYLVQVDQGQMWKRHVDQLRDTAVPPTNSAHPTLTETPTTASDEFLYPTPNETSLTQPSTCEDTSSTTPDSPRYPSRVRHPPDRFM